MSRHEGVSCDFCLRENFAGHRYKCLVCYDFDLCELCQRSGVTYSNHTAQHPMQCILTRFDLELYYGGEGFSPDQSQSLTCPHCGKMGFVETTLAEHVSLQHADARTKVLCPVCAISEPNHVTHDLAAHLSFYHSNTNSSDNDGGGGGGGGGGGSRVGGGGVGGASGQRGVMSFDEPPVTRTIRRLQHSARGGGGGGSGAGGGSGGGRRLRRFTAHFRESMDPITELLSQLSGVRRVSSALTNTALATATATSTVPAHASSSTATATATVSSQMQQMLRPRVRHNAQLYDQTSEQQQQQSPLRRRIYYEPVERGQEWGTAATATTSGVAVAPLFTVPRATTAALAAAAAAAPDYTSHAPPPPPPPPPVSLATLHPVAGQPSRQMLQLAAAAAAGVSSCVGESAGHVQSAEQWQQQLDKALFLQDIIVSTLTRSFEQHMTVSEKTVLLSSAASASHRPTLEPSADLGPSLDRAPPAAAAVADCDLERASAGAGAARTESAVAVGEGGASRKRSGSGPRATAVPRAAAAADSRYCSASGRRGVTPSASRVAVSASTTTTTSSSSSSRRKILAAAGATTVGRGAAGAETIARPPVSR